MHMPGKLVDDAEFEIVVGYDMKASDDCSPQLNAV